MRKVEGEKMEMKEIKKFVEAFNSANPGCIHATGFAVHCDRLELDDNDLRCFIGQNYIASFNLDESMPWFIVEEQIFHIRPGKVEIGDV